MNTLTVVGIVLIVIASVMVAYSAWKDRNNDRVAISFRESIDLTGLPVVTFRQGSNKLNFILDTGSNISVIDEAAVKKLEFELTPRQTSVTGVGGTSGSLNVVEIHLKYKDVDLFDHFQVMDMAPTFDAIKASTGVRAHGLIGNEFMQRYQYIIDFKKMVAITKR